MKTWIHLFIILFFLLLSCGNNIMYPLNQYYFTEGDWLLVNRNIAKNEIRIIDDENVLERYKDDILLISNEDDYYTTCDGKLELYYNGNLKLMIPYLSERHLTESSRIKQSYKKGELLWIEPKDNIEFEILNDSLFNLSNHYPTKYNKQPENKSIIKLYKFK